jgi:hypothetical protein
MDLRSFKAVLRIIATSPVPIKSVTFGENDSFRVDLLEAPRPEVATNAPANASPPRQVPVTKYVPGTNIPDDQSPIHPIDAILNTPNWVVD